MPPTKTDIALKASLRAARQTGTPLLEQKSSDGHSEPAAPDVAAIAEAIKDRLRRSPWVELRAIVPEGGFDGNRWVGRDDDPSAAAAWAAGRNRAGAGVFATINRIDARPDGYAGDGDVAARTTIYIDVDPVRPKDTAATPSQRAAAEVVADAVAADFAALGWGAPAERLDTGNGAALFFPCDPDVSTGAVKALLVALNKRHGASAAKVDLAVWNASRINRLPGTVNTKGADVAARRLCRVVDKNPTPVTITAAMVAAATADAGRVPEAGEAVPPHPERPNMVHCPGDFGDHRPGTDFNCRGSWWSDVLDPGGAKLAVKRGTVEHITRPGKGGGTSATLGHFKSDDGTPLLHVFSDNWLGLESGKTYDLFGAYTRLRHGGNFFAAADALRAVGYGPAGAGSGGRPTPASPSAGTNPNSAASGPPTNAVPAEGPTLLVRDTAVLMGIVDTFAELWRTTRGECYATTSVGATRRHVPVGVGVGDKEYTDLLADIFQTETGRAPHPQALDGAAATTRGRCRRGRTRELHNRVARHNGKVYVDLADRDGTVVEVSEDDWNVCADSLVLFARPPGTLPLPRPEADGAAAELRRLIRVSDKDWTRILGWLVTALAAGGEYPVLHILSEWTGEDTALAAILQSLVDPNVGGIREFVGDKKDLGVAVYNSHVLAYADPDGTSPQMVRVLGRLAAGAGLVPRKSYTDKEQSITRGTRPVLLSGGTAPPSSVTVTVLGPPEGDPRSEFEALRPKMLGVLFKAVAAGLRSERDADTRVGNDWGRFTGFARFLPGIAGPLGLNPDTLLAAFTQLRPAPCTAIQRHDPVTMFLKARFVRDPDGFVPFDRVRDEWFACVRGGNAASTARLPDAREMKKKVTEVFEGVQCVKRRRDGKQRRGYEGIGLRAAVDADSAMWPCVGSVGGTGGTGTGQLFQPPVPP